MKPEVVYTIIAAVAAVCSIIFGGITLKRSVQKDCDATGRERGELKADTEYIKRRIDDVLLEQKDTNKSISILSERVTRVEESTKSAHRRIDLIEKHGQDE